MAVRSQVKTFPPEAAEAPPERWTPIEGGRRNGLPVILTPTGAEGCSLTGGAWRTCVENKAIKQGSRITFKYVAVQVGEYVQGSQGLL